MIEINNLEVYYGTKLALSIDQKIELNANDRIGIIGSNGSGKTTFVRAILDLVKCKGEIKKAISIDDIAVHMQDNNYIETFKVKFIIESILDTKIKDNKKLADIIKFFDFEESLTKTFKQLSGGQKQRLTIILVLMQDRKLTFFDEVTSGLDFETRKVLMEKIKQWYEDKDSALCIVSHYFEELEQIANKILIIEQGEIIDFDTPQNLFKKYCGHSIVVLDNNEYNQALCQSEKRILAPEHLIALSFASSEAEIVFSNVLIEKNIGYKRSNTDLEIMYFNAKKRGVDNEKDL